jgi:hypothetical protein
MQIYDGRRPTSLAIVRLLLLITLGPVAGVLSGFELHTSRTSVLRGAKKLCVGSSSYDGIRGSLNPEHWRVMNIL